MGLPGLDRATDLVGQLQHPSPLPSVDRRRRPGADGCNECRKLQAERLRVVGWLHSDIDYNYRLMERYEPVLPRVTVRYAAPDAETQIEKETLKLLNQVRKERKSLVTLYEAFLIHSVARAQCQRPGELAEVGVYQGGSAKLICEVKGDLPLHLFDTFEGFADLVAG